MHLLERRVGQHGLLAGWTGADALGRGATVAHELVGGGQRAGSEVPARALAMVLFILIQKGRFTLVQSPSREVGEDVLDRALVVLEVAGGDAAGGGKAGGAWAAGDGADDPPVVADVHCALDVY